MHNGSSTIKRNQKGLIEATIELQDETFKEGHEVKSQTKAPKFMKSKIGDQEIIIADGPGINDSNFRHEYANQTAI